ncbi:hypothetical protein bcgnr5378_08140 [Bacillus cereus]
MRKDRKRNAYIIEITNVLAFSTYQFLKKSDLYVIGRILYKKTKIIKTRL